MKKTLTFTFKKEVKGFSIQCNELKGVISQGDNLKDAIINISESLIGFIETFGAKELQDSWKAKKGY